MATSSRWPLSGDADKGTTGRTKGLIGHRLLLNKRYYSRTFPIAEIVISRIINQKILIKNFTNQVNAGQEHADQEGKMLIKKILNRKLRIRKILIRKILIRKMLISKNNAQGSSDQEKYWPGIF